MHTVQLTIELEQVTSKVYCVATSCFFRPEMTVGPPRGVTDLYTQQLSIKNSRLYCKTRRSTPHFYQRVVLIFSSDSLQGSIHDPHYGLDVLRL